MKKILFIISSAIDISKNPLCYTPVRSVFSVENRARQTLQTIQSIRTIMPEAKILFVELGQKNDLPDDITTGLRRGELLGLEWKHIDIDKGTIHVKQSLAYVDKKHLVKEPKTKNSVRTVQYANH